MNDIPYHMTLVSYIRLLERSVVIGVIRCVYMVGGAVSPHDIGRELTIRYSQGFPIFRQISSMQHIDQLRFNDTKDPAGREGGGGGGK